MKTTVFKLGAVAGIMGSFVVAGLGWLAGMIATRRTRH